MNNKFLAAFLCIVLVAATILAIILVFFIGNNTRHFMESPDTTPRPAGTILCNNNSTNDGPGTPERDLTPAEFAAFCE